VSIIPLHALAPIWALEVAVVEGEASLFLFFFKLEMNYNSRQMQAKLVIQAGVLEAISLLLRGSPAPKFSHLSNPFPRKGEERLPWGYLHEFQCANSKEPLLKVPT